MNDMKSADPQKLAEHLRKGAKFDVMKAREVYFRPYDNQMVMEMYAVREGAGQDEGSVGHLRCARRGARPARTWKSSPRPRTAPARSDETDRSAHELWNPEPDKKVACKSSSSRAGSQRPGRSTTCSLRSAFADLCARRHRQPARRLYAIGAISRSCSPIASASPARSWSHPLPSASSASPPSVCCFAGSTVPIRS